MSASFLPLEIIEDNSNLESPRAHLLKGVRNNTPRAGLSNEQIYRRKQNSRKRRQTEITKDEAKQRYFQWIDDIQEALGLKDSNAAFASRICKNGGQVTCQTVKLWKRRTGHYPNKMNHKALLRLERESKLEVIDIKFIVRLIER